MSTMVTGATGFDNALVEKVLIRVAEMLRTPGVRVDINRGTKQEDGGDGYWHYSLDGSESLTISIQKVGV